MTKLKVGEKDDTIRVPSVARSGALRRLPFSQVLNKTGRACMYLAHKHDVGHRQYAAALERPQRVALLELVQAPAK